MEEALGNFYCLFESFFGQFLAEFLWGYNCQTGDYSGKNLFNSIGFFAISVSLVFVILYYYLRIYPFNHPRSNRWWNWLIILLISGCVNFVIAYAWTITDFQSGNIGDCLMYARDLEGNIVSQQIYKKDCWLFGLSNFFVSTLFFIIWTMFLKWGSRNCNHSPCF